MFKHKIVIHPVHIFLDVFLSNQAYEKPLITNTICGGGGEGVKKFIL